MSAIQVIIGGLPCLLLPQGQDPRKRRGKKKPGGELNGSSQGAFLSNYA